MHDPKMLRKLAFWYREFAERAENLAIWEGRLHKADDLDHEAERIERDVPAASDDDAKSARPSLRAPNPKCPLYHSDTHKG